MKEQRQVDRLSLVGISLGLLGLGLSFSSGPLQSLAIGLAVAGVLFSAFAVWLTTP